MRTISSFTNQRSPTKSTCWGEHASTHRWEARAVNSEGCRHYCRPPQLSRYISYLSQLASCPWVDAHFLLRGCLERKWFLHETAHSKGCGLSCVIGSDFKKETLLFSFFQVFFLWAPLAGCHLVPLYWEEGDISIADGSKKLQYTANHRTLHVRGKNMYLIFKLNNFLNSSVVW